MQMMRMPYVSSYETHTVISEKKTQTVFHKHDHPKSSKYLSVFQERDGYIFVKFIKPLKLRIKN